MSLRSALASNFQTVAPKVADEEVAKAIADRTKGHAVRSRLGSA